MPLLPVGMPDSQKVEVEFVAGTWTDVTAYVELLSQGPMTSQFGRTSVYSQPGPGTMTVTLKNDLYSGNGRFTPQRQVLADGVTPHPYWPNVLPRKRIRRSYTIAGNIYTRFFGYIKGWPPALESGVRPMVTIQATTRDDRLSRVTMKSPIAQEITPDTPDLWWPLTDAAGSTQAVQAPQVGAYPLVASYTGPAPTFGDNGPGAGDGTGVKFAPASSSSGQVLVAALPLLDIRNGLTVECWVNTNGSLPAWASGAGNSEVILGFATDAGPHLVLSLVNGVPRAVDSGTVNASASINDGGWHHLAVTRAVNLTDPFTFYVDGVSQGTAASSSWSAPGQLRVGDDASAVSIPARFQGNIGQIAIYATVLSAARIAAHASTANGYSGDTTDARVQRYLAFGGSTLGLSLDAGQTTVGTYPQAGKDVTSACQDMATTEGGVFWVNPAGVVRFANRRFRDATTPVLTLDAASNLDATVYDPAFDETTLINSSTVSRSAESGTLSTQTYTDPVSVAAYGPTSGDVTTYTQSDQDALNLAQAQVAGNSAPAFRLNQVAVNCHAATASLYAALGAVEIGSRIRIINLPPGAAPLGTIDLFVEGWREEVTNATYRVVFDTSPAGSPQWKWDTSRWQASGQTLDTALTNSGTTVSIATSAGNPTFTTTSGMYPLVIQIGQEQIQLNTAPGGATSPQSFTGVTRGVNGTPAAAQAAGSVISLAPASAWAL